MRTEAHANAQRWTKPATPDQHPEAGYDAWLKADIAAGAAELDAGQGIPADKVWRSLGLE